MRNAKQISVWIPSLRWYSPKLNLHKQSQFNQEILAPTNNFPLSILFLIVHPFSNQLDRPFWTFRTGSRNPKLETRCLKATCMNAVRRPSKTRKSLGIIGWWPAASAIDLHHLLSRIAATYHTSEYLFSILLNGSRGWFPWEKLKTTSDGERIREKRPIEWNELVQRNTRHRVFFRSGDFWSLLRGLFV